MVIVFDAHAADTPSGNSVAVPIPVAPVVVCVMFVKAVFTHKVGVEEAAPTDIVVALLKTSKIAELGSLDDKVTVRFPVEPLFTDDSHAAPTVASSPFVVPLSNNSVWEFDQELKVLLPLHMANIITAELLATVTPVAVAVAETALLKVPGTISNGPPALPSGFNALQATPEKATIEPIAISQREFIAKVKLAPSEPSATR